MNHGNHLAHLVHRQIRRDRAARPSVHHVPRRLLVHHQSRHGHHQSRRVHRHQSHRDLLPMLLHDHRALMGRPDHAHHRSRPDHLLAFLYESTVSRSLHKS
ncbi:uncharacterized protein PHACADRAFT_165859 [Phanerochaete carnosa HHB-10118-sp]|uniref:Uncharacterized protein n=1 Tax=Phanerochaete carnosa (strain HHB-10118-sp) TaxID=650164 RepID=K5VWT8_PHACS|nr:uncharacterized protein PHACADRAFT_165859 [Phanerochaete carnosa HHB-10118-sp]EKM51265.1 hypothetical protein PHACADRAFT_165859 [Phanerochaete carnosa HHB-10118-sp]